MPRPLVTALATLAALAALAASAGAAAPTLRWASAGDAQTLDPHAQNELFTNALNGQVYEFLVARDKQLKIVPALATEWKQDGPLKWTFKLRKGATFHNGKTVTANVDQRTLLVQLIRENLHQPGKLRHVRCLVPIRAAGSGRRIHHPLRLRHHPRQPVGLKPQLSTDLQIDNIVSMSPVKMTRREAAKAIIPVVYEGSACCTPPSLQGAV